MTVRRSRFYGALIAILTGGTLALFVIGWVGYRMPEWIDEARWVLLLIGLATGATLAIIRRIETNQESFRLGVTVGQYREHADFPTHHAGTHPHHKRG